MLRVHFRPAGTCVPRRANEQGRKDPTGMGRGVPQFLVRREPRYKSLREALAALWASGQPAGANHSARLSRSLVESQAHLPRRALITSGLLHFAVMLFL